MNSNEIIKNAFKYKDYVYWYGGKAQKCTQNLLNILSSLYPNIYTQTYINKCKIDIQKGHYCIDCSALVCRAYNINDLGSYQLMEKYKKIPVKEAKPGMMLWKKGHISICLGNNYMIEAKGIDYDVLISKYKYSDFVYCLYSEDVDYIYEYEYDTGWHQDATGWWYAYGNQKGCYYKNVTLEIEGKPYTFNEEGYIL